MTVTEHGIYLSFNNQAEGFQIPVNPESIEVREPGKGKTYDIVGKGGGTEETRAGEINVIKNPGLREIKFSSIFPAQKGPYVVKGVQLFPPMWYVGMIRKWMSTKYPIRFVSIGHDYDAAKKKNSDMSIPASIESFDWKEVAGAPDDIEYTLSLKEYVFYSARLSKFQTRPNGEKVLVQQPPGQPDERVMPETYTMVSGDTLNQISKRFYGDTHRARDIQKLNGIKDSETRQLLPGRVLKLPPKG
ncbi:lytic transglycosylase [Paenibacillus elgii]|uniref:lytic transglycosylase n=1 Tax=Paenibacillus elgii TaxID=189691 RepID=UPI0020410712|nr:LysM peptidoglycan-binding domain-containing protein [Paenibacillus elgii]MCM3273655.1 LysM peptidoglycan-binding domain-containing protein [Paenibacillus elgii]